MNFYLDFFATDSDEENIPIGFVQKCFMALFFKRFMNALPKLTALSYESCLIIPTIGANHGFISQDSILNPPLKSINIEQINIEDKYKHYVFNFKMITAKISTNKGIRDAGSTADIRMLWPWSALVCLGLL